MNFRIWLANLIVGPAPDSPCQCEVFPLVMRAPGWSAVRNEWLRLHPRCEACVNPVRAFLNFHHLIPVNVDRSRELDPENLITLCVNGPFGINCHAIFGHSGNWRDWNLNVWSDAQRFRRMLRERSRG